METRRVASFDSSQERFAEKRVPKFAGARRYVRWHVTLNSPSSGRTRDVFSMTYTHSRDSIHPMKVEAHITYMLLDVSGKQMDATDLAGHLVTIGLPKGGAIQHLRDITNEEYTFLVTDIKEFWPDAPYQWRAEVTLQLVG